MNEGTREPKGGGGAAAKRGWGRKNYTDKKENQIFLIYKAIQKGSDAKSYMTEGLLIYG